ncbi:MAG: hypothetical protein N2544_09390 [Burkholderiales bacterium]|nr:hypothetical protein [Burkholderiales bacterium]
MSLADYPKDKRALTERIHANLARVKSLRGGLAKGVAADRTALRAWQAGRLARTHADLLVSDRYRPAAEFFLSDLYGPKDVSKRDGEVERILPSLVALLPAGAIQSLAMALEVDALSEALDALLVEKLRAEQRDPARPLAIDEKRYAAAYRACANRAEREQQIELIDAIGTVLDKVAHKPLITAAVDLARGPAHLAGLGEIHEFLERGLHAFRHMSRADEFLAIIRRRETALMDRLFAGAPDPFATPD